MGKSHLIPKKISRQVTAKLLFLLLLVSLPSPHQADRGEGPEQDGVGEASVPPAQHDVQPQGFSLSFSTTLLWVEDDQYKLLTNRFSILSCLEEKI